MILNVQNHSDSKSILSNILWKINRFRNKTTQTNDCSKSFKIVQNRSKLFKIVQNHSKLIKIVQNHSKLILTQKLDKLICKPQYLFKDLKTFGGNYVGFKRFQTFEPVIVSPKRLKFKRFQTQKIQTFEQIGPGMGGPLTIP